jgi:uncharacterized protein
MNSENANTNKYEKRIYEGLRSLADLPYFELADDGKLRLTVDGLDGGIDGHVHFALNALAGPKPDLLLAHPETKYCMSVNNTISMDNYMGQNFSEQDMSITLDCWLSILTPAGSAITSTHTIPNLIAEMDRMHIEKSVVLPIAYGFPYGDDMSEWYLDSIRKSGKADRFIICGSVKPTMPDAVEKVKALKLKGVRGIKIHPMIAWFNPNDKRAWAFYEECSLLGLPVLAHSGLNQLSAEIENPDGFSGRQANIDNFVEPISDFPDLRFVLCHSGCLQNEKAVEIAKHHKNVWMDIQGQSVANIRTMIRELGPERLMFGSDWPFFPVEPLMARLLMATEGDRTIRKMIFSENAARFWGTI